MIYCDSDFWRDWSRVEFVLFRVQLTVRLKDICSMTKEKTARLIPNAIQVCTDTEKVSLSDATEH